MARVNPSTMTTITKATIATGQYWVALPRGSVGISTGTLIVTFATKIAVTTKITASKAIRAGPNWFRIPFLLSNSEPGPTPAPIVPSNGVPGGA